MNLSIENFIFLKINGLDGILFGELKTTIVKYYMRLDDFLLLENPVCNIVMQPGQFHVAFNGAG